MLTLNNNSIYFKSAGNSKLDTTHNKSWHFVCLQFFLHHEKHHLWTVRSWISNIPNDQNLPWRITSWNLPQNLVFFIMCWLLRSNGFILASTGALSVPQVCTGEFEMINYVISSHRGRGDTQSRLKRYFEYQCSASLYPLVCTTHHPVHHMPCHNIASQKKPLASVFYLL